MTKYLFAALIALTSAAPAVAANRQVNIVNATANTMVRFYATAGGTADAQEDVLGDRILKPGQSVRIDVDDGSGACLYDFRAEFDDGSKRARRKIDVCQITTYRYTAD